VWAISEPLEDRAPRGIGERDEDNVIAHALYRQRTIDVSRTGGAT
jgi:hypothetical protein